MSCNPNQLKLSFDEFKLYYESAEKVTQRRHETNRWNYTVCVATLVAIAAITNWSLSATNLFGVGLVAVAILCVMAFLFCILWIGQIRMFKKLNNAKFQVLNQMAPHLEFDPDKPGVLVSYIPFEKEWNTLRETDALEVVERSKLIALKSSNIEYFIPKAFGALFGGILLALIIVLAMNWPPSNLVEPQGPFRSVTIVEQEK